MRGVRTIIVQIMRIGIRLMKLTGCAIDNYALRGKQFAYIGPYTSLQEQDTGDKKGKRGYIPMLFRPPCLTSLISMEH
jgi:hypothetical protein